MRIAKGHFADLRHLTTWRESICFTRSVPFARKYEEDLILRVSYAPLKQLEREKSFFESAMSKSFSFSNRRTPHFLKQQITRFMVNNGSLNKGPNGRKEKERQMAVRSPYLKKVNGQCARILHALTRRGNRCQDDTLDKGRRQDYRHDCLVSYRKMLTAEDKRLKAIPNWSALVKEVEALTANTQTYDIRCLNYLKKTAVWGYAVVEDRWDQGYVEQREALSIASRRAFSEWESFRQTQTTETNLPGQINQESMLGRKAHVVGLLPPITEESQEDLDELRTK